ncbi:PQQ-binding-like beta-propeller repeat protein [Streptomyces sp. NPDC018693]|uniref:outer membrane protein assembly factor BamB family protein n=1 Tax=unclassified Streptomyces TaxID=2593676 RepID=UPI003790FC35
MTVENRTAVLYRASDREEAHCDHVAFFDLDDGKETWAHTIPVSTSGSLASAPQRTPSVTLTRGTVVVTWGGGTSAHDMDGGKQSWRTTATGSCKDEGAAGGRGLLIRQVCWTEGDTSGGTYSVRRVDLATGRTSWTYTAARGALLLGIPSAEPPVLAVSAGGTAITDLLSLDDKGRHRATIGFQNGTYVGASHLDYLVVSG